MPAWALRAVAAGIAMLAMLASTTYALAHPKNPNAPLQPPVAATPEPERVAEATPAPTLPFRTLAPTVAPTPTTPPPRTPAPTGMAMPSATIAPTLRPTPRTTLGAAVRATTLPKITITHSS